MAYQCDKYLSNSYLFFYRHQVSSTTTITLGKLDQRQNIPGITRSSTVRVFEHPQYNPNTIDNDIALLKLNNPVAEFNDYVRPVCMATTSNEFNEYSDCHVVGWGALSQGGSKFNLFL